MTQLQQIIETLIDQLLLRVPSQIFVDFPLLGVLLANPNGRYVLGCLAVVVSSIGLWILLRIVLTLFSNQTKFDTDLSGYSDNPSATHLSASPSGSELHRCTVAERRFPGLPPGQSESHVE